MVVEHMKSVLLQELIKREMHQTDFIYNDDDRAILSRMFDDLNSKTGANYHYLAEIAFQLAPNIGTIILPYFDLFHSESVRAYLVPQLVFDKIPSCDSVIYNGYLRFKQSSFYIPEKGKSCPTEILEAIVSVNAEGRPIWKPMHMQPIYRLNPFVNKDGNARAKTNAYIEGGCTDVGADIFNRGLCLPSDNKMTASEQDVVIKAIIECFK